MESKCTSWVPRKFTCTSNTIKEMFVGVQVSFSTFSDSQKTTLVIWILAKKQVVCGSQQMTTAIGQLVRVTFIRKANTKMIVFSSFTGYSSHCLAKTEAFGTRYWSQWVHDTAFCWMFKRPEYYVLYQTFGQSFYNSFCGFILTQLVTYHAIALQPVAYPFLYLFLLQCFWTSNLYLLRCHISQLQSPLPLTTMFMNIRFTYMRHTIQYVDNNKIVGTIDLRPVLLWVFKTCVLSMLDTSWQLWYTCASDKVIN